MVCLGVVTLAILTNRHTRLVCENDNTQVRVAEPPEADAAVRLALAEAPLGLALILGQAAEAGHVGLPP